jgi:hypothetical protein
MEFHTFLSKHNMFRLAFGLEKVCPRPCISYDPFDGRANVGRLCCSGASLVRYDDLPKHFSMYDYNSKSMTSDEIMNHPYFICQGKFTFYPLQYIPLSFLQHVNIPDWLQKDPTQIKFIFQYIWKLNIKSLCKTINRAISYNCQLTDDQIETTFRLWCQEEKKGHWNHSLIKTDPQSCEYVTNKPEFWEVENMFNKMFEALEEKNYNMVRTFWCNLVRLIFQGYERIT